MRGASGVYQNARTRVVRLSAVMSALFVLLSIPVLIFIKFSRTLDTVAGTNARVLWTHYGPRRTVRIKGAATLSDHVAACLFRLVRPFGSTSTT